MTIYKALHLSDDIYRLYIKKIIRKRTCEQSRWCRYIDMMTRRPDKKMWTKTDYCNQKKKKRKIQTSTEQQQLENGNGKQSNWYFKWQTSDIAPKKTGTWLRKGSLKRETDSHLIAAQNNATRTKYVKAKMDKFQ